MLLLIFAKIMSLLLLLLLLYYFINFFMKIIFIFSCFGMFRNVPCSGFYRRPTSVQYNSGVPTDCLYNECIRKRCSFQRKIFTCEVASFGLFQNRLLDSAGLALKRNSCLVAEKGIFSGAIWFL